MVWELQRGMQGTLACALIMHVERRLRGIAEGERWRHRTPRMPSAQEYPFRNGERGCTGGMGMVVTGMIYGGAACGVWVNLIDCGGG
jgi:hypothetical protein